MSIAIVDFTRHPDVSNIAGIQEIIQGLLEDNDSTLLDAFYKLTMKTFFHMLQKGYTPFPRDVAEAVLLYQSTAKFDNGRRGIRELTSTWAKERFPQAKYEIVITLVKYDGSVVHTFLIYT
jgi:hypothetical protein